MSDDKGTRNESEAKEDTLPSSSVGDYSPERDPDDSEQHTAHKKYPSDESRQWWERFPWQGFLSVIIVVIYGFQAYFMQGQLDVMNAQLTEMRSGSADTKTVAEAAQRSAAVAQQALVATQEVVEASRVQAEAARQQTETARQALSSTNEIFHMERRAWVSIVEYKAFMDGGIGEWWWFDVSIKNDGPTPALNVRSIAEVRAFPRKKKFFPIYRDKGVGQGGVLSPGFRPDLTTAPTVLTQELSEALKDGSSLLYVYGRILYDDVFRHSHRTTFCMYFPAYNPSAEAPFVPCPTYNEAD